MATSSTVQLPPAAHLPEKTVVNNQPGSTAAPTTTNIPERAQQGEGRPDQRYGDIVKNSGGCGIMCIGCCFGAVVCKTECLSCCGKSH